MTGEWYELFDAAKVKGREILPRVADLVATFDPTSMKVPAIIGHSSGYKRGSKIPVGAWVDQVKQEGTKLLGKFRFPKLPSTPPPGEFAELQKFSEWFREAVNGGMYETHSIAVKPGDDGRWRLREVAFLGQQQPECKGMPKVEFQEASEEDEWAAEFSDDEANLIRIDTMKIAGKGQEFSEVNISKLDEAEQSALQEIVDILLDEFKLGDLGTCQQVLGVLKAKVADADKAKTEASAIANAGIFAPVAGNPMAFSEKGQAAIMELIQSQLKPLADKLQEYADAAPPTPPAAGDAPPAGDTKTMSSLGKDDATLAADADKAKTTLQSAKIWIPAWDEQMPPILKMMANCPYNGGSLLDAFVTAMQALPAIADFMESGIAEVIDIEEFAEQKRRSANRPHPVSIAAGSQKVVGLDKVIEFEEEAARDNKTFQQVVMEHRAKGEAV